MVATRKGPSAPATSNVRSNSTQPTPRSTSKGNAPNKAHNHPGKQSAPVSSSTKSKKPAAKKIAKKRAPYFLTTLSLIVLQVLALYALLTCPSGRNSSSPLCRSVVQYKHRVLDPYILPPIHSALSHPSAQPYVTKVHAFQKQVEPYVLKSVEVARPIAERAGDATWKTWHGVIVPLYTKHVIPQYQTFVAPHVDKIVALYHFHVSPHVDRAQSAALAAYNAVRPHVERVYGIVKPLAVRIWLNVKPQLIKFWNFSRPHLLTLWASTCRIAGIAAGHVGKARREYVDPHVNKIWQKAAELSRNGASTASAPRTTETEATTIEPTPTESIVSAESIPAITSASPPPESSSIAAEESPSASTPSDTASTPATEPLPSSVDAPPPAPPADASSSTPLVGELSSSSSASAVEPSSSVDAIPSPAAEEPPAPPSEPSSQPKTPESTADEEDFDDLFGDLDEEEKPKLTPEEYAKLVAEQQAEAEKDAAEREQNRKEQRKQRTAENRKDVMARHAEWEEKLSEFIKEHRKVTRTKLVDHRKAHHEVLVGKYEEGKEVSGSQIRALIDSSETEGERLLSGMEAFLKKSVKTMDSPDFDSQSSIKKWQRAAERVKEKFEEQVKATQVGLFDWYTTMRSWEFQLILDTEEEGKSIASSAQLDVGLDYTWLDDVRVADWTRYHKIMEDAVAFGQEIRQIQNGTHASPPVDPIPEAMGSIQTEMEELIQGFQAAWSGIRTEGIDVLSGNTGKADQDTSDPTVSILPISPEPVDGVKKTSEDAFVGRGAEEVQAAFERAGDAAVPDHEEL